MQRVTLEENAGVGDFEVPEAAVEEAVSYVLPFGRTTVVQKRPSGMATFLIKS